MIDADNLERINRRIERLADEGKIARGKVSWDDIQPGNIYHGGKNGDARKVLRFGASFEWVVWGNPRDTLPLGGHHGPTQCTRRAQFVKWCNTAQGAEARRAET